MKQFPSPTLSNSTPGRMCLICINYKAPRHQRWQSRESELPPGGRLHSSAWTGFEHQAESRPNAADDIVLRPETRAECDVDYDKRSRGASHRRETQRLP